MDYQWDYCHEMFKEDDEEESTDAEKMKDYQMDKQ